MRGVGVAGTGGSGDAGAFAAAVEGSGVPGALEVADGTGFAVTRTGLTGAFSGRTGASAAGAASASTG
jgi:hypothetical protein